MPAIPLIFSCAALRAVRRVIPPRATIRERAPRASNPNRTRPSPLKSAWLRVANRGDKKIASACALRARATALALCAEQVIKSPGLKRRWGCRASGQCTPCARRVPAKCGAPETMKIKPRERHIAAQVRHKGSRLASRDRSTTPVPRGRRRKISALVSPSRSSVKNHKRGTRRPALCRGAAFKCQCALMDRVMQAR